MQSEKSRDKVNILLFSVSVLVAIVSGGFWFIHSAKLTYASPTSDFNLQENNIVINQEINVVNNVGELEVIGTKIVGERFVVSVRNKSQKVMNSFYVMSGNQSWQVELIYSDISDGVLPSAEHEIPVPLIKDLYSNGLAIQAILFDDGTGAGQPVYMNMMLDRRRGEKRELAKGKRMLEEFISQGEAKSKEKLEQLKQKFISAESANVPEQNESLKLGIHLGRQRFLHSLDQLSKRIAGGKSTNFDSELKNLDARLRKYVSKL